MNSVSQEEWLAISGFPAYEVSNHGRVRSYWCRGYQSRRYLTDTPQRILKPLFDKRGYLYVRLFRNSKSYRFFVHQLVLLTFIGPRPHGTESCHNDGNKLNNSPSNLRWDTPANNYADVRKHGSQKGMNHPSSKLIDEQIIKIRKMASQGFIHEIIGKMFGVSREAISGIVRRRYWAHIH